MYQCPQSVRIHGFKTCVNSIKCVKKKDSTYIYLYSFPTGFKTIFSHIWTKKHDAFHALCYVRLQQIFGGLNFKKEN